MKKRKVLISGIILLFIAISSIYLAFNTGFAKSEDLRENSIAYELCVLSEDGRKTEHVTFYGERAEKYSESAFAGAENYSEGAFAGAENYSESAFAGAENYSERAESALITAQKSALEFAPESAPKTAPSVVFKKYNKGDNHLNIIINFVNYAGDSVNHFTAREISDKLSELKGGLCNYFERITQGNLAVQVDYIVCSDTKGYGYYKSYDGYSFESEERVFDDSLRTCSDENGVKKSLAFSDYQVKLNVFAGDASGWNTFLWPHAWTSSGLILIMENRGDVGTVSHELIHILGLPDLYFYDNNSQTFGVGDLDIMGYSTVNNNLNAYYRYKGGWLDISEYGDEINSPIETLQREDINGQELDLAPSFYYGDGVKTLAYKFGENKARNEFFMVEYRVKNYDRAYDTNLRYEKQIVIYRVSADVNGNTEAKNPNGRAEIMFMGNLDKDVTTYDYIYSCSLLDGSYGSIELSNRCFAYSSGGGVENLFNGDILPFRLSIRSMTEKNAVISIDYLEYYYVTPIINGAGSLSVTGNSGVEKYADCKVEFYPDKDNVVTSIKIDGKSLDFKEVMECVKNGGYTFKSISANHTIEVSFGKLIYNLDYQLNGGEFTENVDNTYTCGKDFTLPVPKKTDFEFLGWAITPFGTEYVTQINTGDYGDKVLYAQWKRNVFYITVTSAGQGNAPTEGKIPVIINNDKQIDFTPHSGYSVVRLEIDGEETELNDLIAHINDGYYIFENITCDHTINITYGELKFAISYNTFGGAIMGKEINSYIYGKETALPTAERQGYEFLGWTEDSSERAERIGMISAKTYGDLELFAVWDKIDYEIENDTLIYESGTEELNVRRYLDICARKHKNMQIIFPNGIILFLDERCVNTCVGTEPVNLQTGLTVSKDGLFKSETQFFVNVDKFGMEFMKAVITLKKSILPIERVEWWNGATWKPLNYSTISLKTFSIDTGTGIYRFTQGEKKTVIIVGSLSVIVILVAFLVLYEIYVHRKNKRDKTSYFTRRM